MVNTGYHPMDRLRPVPCARRADFVWRLKGCHQTTILEAARLQQTDLEPLDRGQNPHVEVSLGNYEFWSSLGELLVNKPLTT